MRLKCFDKISGGIESAFPGDGSDIGIGGDQLVFGNADAVTQKVLMQRFAGLLLHQIADIVGVVMELSGDHFIGERRIGIMLMNIIGDLSDGGRFRFGFIGA